MTSGQLSPASLRHSRFAPSLLLALALSFGVSARATCTETETGASAAEWWLVDPSRVEARILQWADAHADVIHLEKQRTFEGRTAYAITVTNRNHDDDAKRTLLFSQPHAHEPAATAGMMSFLAKLLGGVDLSGNPVDLDRRGILDKYVLTFIPDGNPDGRARAPSPWWDGSEYSNDEFLKLAFGREADGGRTKRVGRWSRRVHEPPLIGFAYEKINEHEYVEPNRDRESTFFKLVSRMHHRYRYDLHLDLHQTEFARSKHNCSIFLPFMQQELPSKIQAENVRFGRAVIAAWSRAGAAPVVEPTSAGYGEDQNQYFRKCWGDIFQETPQIVVEVQNNNTRTPPKKQMELIEISILAVIDAAGMP